MSRRGLTFVELIIAATMMAILFVGLSGYLRGGVTVWERATTTAGRVQERRVALSRLSRDLANGLVLSRDPIFGDPPQLPQPQFTGETMRWYAWRPPMGEAPARVQLVRYACESYDGVMGLWRTTLSLGQARMADPGVAPELVLAGCRDFSVRYAYLPAGSSETDPLAGQPLDWSPIWNYPDELPRLVEVTVTLDASAALHQQLLVPAGVLKTFEAEPGSPS